MRDSHNSDMDRLRHEESQRQKAFARKEKAAARAAKAPPEVREVDLHLSRIEYWRTAAKMVKGPGELFTKFVAIAGPVALITDQQCANKNWRINKRPYHWADLPEFDAYFGFPGDPDRSVEKCGLEGHLCAEDSDHASESLVAYIDQWTAELEGQRAVIVDQHTKRIDLHGATGAYQIEYPSWA